MRILVTSTAVALVLGATAATAGQAGSGLRGQVLIEPAFPICRVDQPCTKPAAGVVLVFSKRGVEVKRTRTADDGTYRVALRPGTYNVAAPGPSRVRTLDPTRVSVVRGRYRRVLFKLDIGIQ